MYSFIAVDVETANYERSSICSIGAVKVLKGQIVDSFYQLVRPEPDYYIRRFTAIHGLRDRDTCNARTFDAVWLDFLKFAGELPIIAHNAVFDHGAISAACRVYQLEPPQKFLCTLLQARKVISRLECPSKSLPNLCKFLGIDFNDHHNALADAQACAEIALEVF